MAGAMADLDPSYEHVLPTLTSFVDEEEITSENGIIISDKQDDDIKQLETPIKAIQYNEQVMDWSAPTFVRDVTVRVDSFRQNLIVEERVISTTSVVDVIAFSQMTNVRSVPYYDETKRGQTDSVKVSDLLPNDYAPRFLSVAYYKDTHDFVNVYLMSFVVNNNDGEAAAITQIWREGLATLIKHNSEFNPRYVTMNERVQRIYSGWAARAVNNLVGVAMLKQWFCDRQWVAVHREVNRVEYINDDHKDEVNLLVLTWPVFRILIEDLLLLPQIRASAKKVAGISGDDSVVITAAKFCKLLQRDHRDPFANEVLRPLPTIDDALMKISLYELSDAYGENMTANKTNSLTRRNNNNNDTNNSNVNSNNDDDNNSSDNTNNSTNNNTDNYNNNNNNNNNDVSPSLAEGDDGGLNNKKNNRKDGTNNNDNKDDNDDDNDHDNNDDVDNNDDNDNDNNDNDDAQNTNDDNNDDDTNNTSRNNSNNSDASRNNSNTSDTSRNKSNTSHTSRNKSNTGGDAAALLAKSFSVRGFYRFIQSDENDYLNPEHRLTDPSSLTKPLAHYFCYSSHNSYLAGHQLTGRSVVEMYRQILLSGCRCLELDTWDGHDADNRKVPVVTHTPSLTLTTKILFHDCIKAVMETAFITSDYPVVLSFENHCSKANQIEMARICREEFGTFLCTQYEAGHGGIGMDGPSPEFLKRKIVIKNKRLKSLVQQAVPESKRGILSSPRNEVDGGGGSALSLLPPNTPNTLNSPNSVLSSMLNSPSSEMDEDDTAGDGSDPLVLEPITLEVDGEVVEETLEELCNRAARSKNITKEMSDIVNYVWPVHFKGFEVAAATKNYYHMSSFGEKKAEKLVLGEPDEFVNYTRNQIARIYPRGDRTTSSNYQPMLFWNVGAQMVALNFQTDDVAMHLNRGRFLTNGCCGFVPKPSPFLRMGFNPMTSLNIDGVIAIKLRITVLAACVGGDRPQVKIDTYGLGKDTFTDFKSKPFRPTKPPVAMWGGNPSDVVEFDPVVLPQQLMVHISVVDSAGVSQGWECVCAASLTPGYHIIPLRAATSLMAHVLLKINVDINKGTHDKLVGALVDPVKYSSYRKTDQNKALMKKLLGGNGLETSSNSDSRSSAVITAEKVTETASEPISSQFSTQFSTQSSTQFSTQLSKESLSHKMPQRYDSSDHSDLNDYDMVRRREEVVLFDKECNDHVKELKQSGEDAIALFANTETKALIAMREQHRKQRLKAMTTHNKALLSLRQVFARTLQGVFRTHGNCGVANVRGGHEALVEAEIKHKRAIHDAFAEFLVAMHTMMCEHERETGELKLSELEKIHARRAKKGLKFMAERLDFALEKIQKQFFEVKGRSKKSHDDMKRWHSYKEGVLTDGSQNVISRLKEVDANHMAAEVVQVRTMLETASNELQVAQAWDVETLKTFFEAELARLVSIKAEFDSPERVKWETMTYKQYLAMLVTHYRLPKL